MHCKYNDNNVSDNSTRCGYNNQQNTLSENINKGRERVTYKREDDDEAPGIGCTSSAAKKCKS